MIDRVHSHGPRRARALRIALLCVAAVCLATTAHARGRKISEPALVDHHGPGVSRARYLPGKGKLFLHPPEGSDVQQWKTDACHMLAPASALARMNPQLITDMIKQRPDGNYAVRLHRKKHGGGYRPVEVLVTDKVAVVKVKNLALKGRAREDSAGLFLATSRAADPREAWVGLLEKAFAKLRGGYAKIAGGFVPHSLSALTGRPSEQLFLHGDKAHTARVLEQLRQAVEEGRPVVVSTYTRQTLRARSELRPGRDKRAYARAYERAGLMRGHAYAVWGYSMDHGQPMIELRNGVEGLEPKPGGGLRQQDGIFKIPASKLARYFEDVVIGL